MKITESWKLERCRMFVEIVFGDERRHRFLINPDSQSIHFIDYVRKKLNDLLPISMNENERLMLVNTKPPKDKQIPAVLVDIGKQLPHANISSLFQDRDLYLPIVAKMNQLQQLMDYQLLYKEKPVPEDDIFDPYETEMSNLKQRIVENLSRMKVEALNAKGSTKKSEPQRKGRTPYGTIKVSHPLVSKDT